MCKNCYKKGGCTMSMTAYTLVIIGGVNWGLVGLGILLGSMESWNVINMILGSVSWLEGIVYVLIGIAAIVMIFGCKCSKCKSDTPVSSTNVDENKTEGSV